MGWLCLESSAALDWRARNQIWDEAEQISELQKRRHRLSLVPFDRCPGHFGSHPPSRTKLCALADYHAAMNQQRRSRIPDVEWENRKDLIKQLFLDERKTLEGDDGLISILERDYGFSARSVTVSSILCNVFECNAD